MIDIGIIFSTFLVVFFAELGDKTQLVAFSMTSTSKNPWIIFISTSLALSLSSVLAAILGVVTAQFVPGVTVYISGALFILFGGLILFLPEAPKIKECFLKTLSQENYLTHILPRLFRKAPAYHYQVMNIVRQEHSHSEIFKFLLKEKKLFKDDINEESVLDEMMEALEVKGNLLRKPLAQALEDVIRLEKAGLAVYSFINNHLDADHHNDTNLQKILCDLVKEEEGHIRFFETCLKDVKEAEGGQ